MNPQHFRSATASAFLVLFVLLASACPRNIPPPENALESPEELRNAVDARLEGLETARFKEVVIDYFGEGERVKVRQLILVARPDRVRVQTRIPGTDEILSLLVSNGETFAMHQRDTNQYFTGEATPENIARLLPVDLTPTDINRVMLGGAPWDRFDSHGKEAAMDWDRKRGKYAYRVETRDGGNLVMWVRPTDYAVERVREFDANDKVIYRYETDKWESNGPVALPAWRRFVWPARDLDFSMDVGETQTNVELPDMLFELSPPAGSEIITVDR